MPDSPSSPSRTIRAEPLTAAGFAPFGTVIEAGTTPGRLVNQGRARRIEGLRDLSHEGTMPVVDLYRVEQSGLPFTVNCLERHPLSCQIFTPMTCVAYLVVVAPDDHAGRPDVALAKAFTGHGAQAVCYRRGTWHAPMIALDAPALMTMTMWEAGGALDCEEIVLDDRSALTVAG